MVLATKSNQEHLNTINDNVSVHALVQPLNCIFESCRYTARHSEMKDLVSAKLT